MQPNYLLLRNNQQTGPYNLEQLLQLHLKPFDLVWVNGRSAAWQYPGEISELKPYVPHTPQPEIPFKPIATAAMEQHAEPVGDLRSNTTAAPAKHVFVSMPKNNSSTFRTTSESKPAAVFDSGDIPDQKPAYAYPEDPIQEAFIPAPHGKTIHPPGDPIETWNVKPAIKRKKSISTKDFSIVILLAGVIAGGYYLLSRPSVVQRSAQVTRKEPVIAESQLESPVTPVKNESISKTSDMVSIPAAETVKNAPLPVAVKKADRKPDKKSSAAVVTGAVARENKPQPDPELSKNPGVETAKTPDVPSPERAPVEKKKKLREVIRNIFTGKKAKSEEPKNNPVVLEEPRPATNRKAARREDDPPASSNTTHDEALPLADLIDITTNAPDNWMMGVSGLKITLRNRSQVVIQTAAVDVMYYDANNRLLERKMVFFNHIPAGGKVIMAAPDNKWADHVDLKLSAVSAKDNRYASN